MRLRRSGRGPLSRHLAPLLVVLVPVVLAFGDVVNGRGIAWFGDNFSTYHPLRLEAARQWTEGRVPLWNPYKRGGAPLAGDIVSAALYPPNVVFAFLEDSPRVAMDVMALLHAALAAWAFFFLMRTLGLSREASVLGGLVYSSNGWAIVTTGFWIGMQNAMAWAPLVLACLERARRQGGWWPWACFGALAYALQILSGFPEYAFYTALLAGGLAITRVFQKPECWHRPVTTLLLIGFGGVLIAAPQVLTTLDAVLQGSRPPVLPVELFTLGSLHPTSLLGLLDAGAPLRLDVATPLSTGAAYMGITALCLVPAAWVRWDGIAVYTVVAALLAAILAVGSFNPLGPVGFHVPGLNSFRGPYRHLFELSLLLAMAAALGAARLQQGVRGTRAIVALTSLGLAAFVALRGPLRAELSTWLPVVAALAATLAVGALAAASRARGAVIVASVGAVLLLGANRAHMLDGIREVLVSKPRPLVLTGAGLRGPERVLALRQVLQLGTEGTLIGDLPTKHRIPAIHGEGAFLWEPLSRALQIDETGFLNGKRIFDPADQSLDVLSVRYLVVHGHAGEFLLMERWVRKLPGVRVVRRGADLLLERPTAFPLSFLAGEVICTADAERLVHTRTYDLSSSALLACDEGKDAQTVASPGTAEIERFEPGRVVIGVEAEGPSSAFLVVSQPDYPGWSATVGGEPARILRTNGLVQGVWIPPGRHRVELEYRPPSFRVGLALSSLALLALVLASIRHTTSKHKVIST